MGETEQGEEKTEDDDGYQPYHRERGSLRCRVYLERYY